MPDVKLSRRQQAIINFISAFVEENGYPPTIREIGAGRNIPSTSVGHCTQSKLARGGLLVRGREASRGLRLVTEHGDHDSKHLSRVPLVRRIGASGPAHRP